MADDVLRLRATVVSDEALAQIRAIGREIGMTPQRAGKGVAEVNKQFDALGQTFKKVTGEVKGMIPGLSGLGVGAASFGAAAVAIMANASKLADKLVELKFAAKELGMSERDIRAFQLAGEKVGISAEAMKGALEGFKSVSDGLKYNIGGVRSELYALGAAPVVQRIQAATNQTEKLREVFKFKDTLLMQQDGQLKARKFFDMMGLGASAVRLTYEEFEKAQQRVKPFSQEDMDRAKEFRDKMIELGETWDRVLAKFGIQTFPALTRMLELLEKGVDLLEKWERLNKAGTLKVDPKVFAPNAGIDPNTGQPLPFDPKNPSTWKNPPSSSGAPLGRPGGFKPISLREGELDADAFRRLSQPPSEGSEASRIVKVGVFDALVEFQSYVQTGGAAAGGYQPAALRVGGGMTATGGQPGMPGVGGVPGAPSGVHGAPGAPAVPGAPGAPGAPTGPGSVTPGAPGSTGPASAGGAAGITAPAGTPIARQGLATVTTPSGKTFKVDARYAENFRGFLADYEKAGGVLGPDTGTLGTRPKNASGHPIGTAIDINQIGYGVRSRKGVSLPPDVEDQLAEKWGLTSGHKWRKPDTGHFGIRSPEAARQALARQGQTPPTAAGPPTVPGVPGKPVYEGGTKATWFNTGPAIGPWDDPSGRREGAQASGLPSTTPGIALPRGQGALRQWYEVTLPDGRKVITQQTDVGPGRGPQKKGIGLDINAALASQLYPGGPSTFPSGKGGFHVRHIGKTLPGNLRPGLQAGAGPDRIDHAIDGNNGGNRLNATGNVNVTVKTNGTKASTDVKSDGLFQKSQVTQHKQMQPTQSPEPALEE